MKITGISLLIDIAEKLERKHGVEQQEVIEIFANHPHIRFVEKGHYPEENVYSALGQINAGRFLAVFFVYKKDGKALVISARRMTTAERRRYEKR